MWKNRRMLVIEAKRFDDGGQKSREVKTKNIQPKYAWSRPTFIDINPQMKHKNPAEFVCIEEVFIG